MENNNFELPREKPESPQAMEGRPLPFSIPKLNSSITTLASEQSFYETLSRFTNEGKLEEVLSSAEKYRLDALSGVHFLLNIYHAYKAYIL